MTKKSLILLSMTFVSVLAMADDPTPVIRFEHTIKPAEVNPTNARSEIYSVILKNILFSTADLILIYEKNGEILTPITADRGYRDIYISDGGIRYTLGPPPWVDKGVSRANPTGTVLVIFIVKAKRNDGP